MDTLAHLGLGEMFLHLFTNALAVVVVLTVVWLMRTVYRDLDIVTETAAVPASAPTSAGSIAVLPQLASISLSGISRQAVPHTTIPSRPRIDVDKYTVQKGDTLFGIATKYNLDPMTILWGNYETLKDNIHSLRPGQVLNILPVNGTYYQWQGTETLTGVAKYFGVDPETIVEAPGNHIDPDAIGDYAHPNIKPGTWLIVPGGEREIVVWSAPIGITRDKPASARIIGDGACGAVSGGAVGFGTFIWPAPKHWLSGTNFHPDLGHPAIDIAAGLDDGISATDAGVVVYAGWNASGYGNLVILDHGNGWQSLYGHLDVIEVSCGQSVGQGDLIALAGSTGNSTGPHLHFELMNTTYGKVNPLDFLPAP